MTTTDWVMKTVSRRTRWVRYSYVGLLALFAVCVVVQIYIAGMAVFIDPANWGMHMGFVHAFELLPLLMLVVAFLGGLPRTFKAIPVVLSVLISVQYATAHLYGSYVAAIHPVNGMVILGVAVDGTKRAWSQVAR
ncbi:DUF6220 domain-containing protein [Haladaptatus sp. AB643]|uniref:DUF6220 domain-containing protein n=1 Tax=Haladaptatus sp. AB643 TaxID=2934174 RepID=UPI00209C2FED|nr:DUF6220 domain-containing protein [Haladaptatus sp. AB643]MCO8243079.1 DUF6220 domain-containing protein [Haladaptatus sp. AB643]